MDRHRNKPNLTSSLVTVGPVAPTPTCDLPSSVSVCQAAWNTWVSRELAPAPSASDCVWLWNYPTTTPCSTSAYWDWSSSVLEPSPACSQASVAEYLCMSLKDVYIAGLTVDSMTASTLFSSGFTADYEYWAAPSTVWTWPTDLPLAPSCTLYDYRHPLIS